MRSEPPIVGRAVRAFVADGSRIPPLALLISGLVTLGLGACDGHAGPTGSGPGDLATDGGSGDLGRPRPDGGEVDLTIVADLAHGADGGADAGRSSEDAATADGAAPADLAAPPDVAGLADLGSWPDVSWEQDPARVTLHGPCPREQRFGGFKVELNEDVGYTAIDGVVRNGVLPGLVPEVALTEGDCVLLRSPHLICEPTCEPGQTCSLQERCIPMPVGQDLGQVVLRGLVEPVVALEPLQPGNTYFFTRLRHPGCAPGRVIQLTSAGGYLEPLELYGVGVEPLELRDERWVLTEGQPLQLGWTPAPEGARSRLFLEVNIDQHGLTPLNLVCELPDTGTAELSQRIVNELIRAGVTGFPTGRVSRRTADSWTDGERCVEFLVTSVRQIRVEVAGHTPCARDRDCPPTQRCNLLIQQCE